MRETFDLPELDLSGSHLQNIVDDDDNPWLTLGIMDNIEDPDLLREWGRMLDLQTRVLGPRETAWLRSKGFGRDSVGVIEPGSGDGNFGAFLSRSFPDTPVYGLEANENLVARFDAASAPRNYGIDICTVGVDPLPERLGVGFDQCILRFVLQHMSDPTPLLKAVYEALPPGGQVFVIEEDHSFFTGGGAWPPYAAATDAWSRVYEAGGSDGAVGRKLPALLTDAGFTVRDFDIVLRNNVEMGEDFLELFTQASRVLHHTRPDLLPGDVLRSIEMRFAEDAERHSSAFVATYPQILLRATKP
ncbi:methyltransferase [Streptomyces sp. NPDC005805]|uniref:methyltransferase n=1 Tax=Streptomyces sp. NPDC005805 TaxID=3157068 RepID=UPI0033D0086B